MRAYLFLTPLKRLAMNPHWKSWGWPRKNKHSSRLLRYGFALVMTGLAIVLAFRLPAMQDTPFIIFLAAVLASALYGGLGPGIATIGLSLLALIYLFVYPLHQLSYTRDLEDVVRLVLFSMVSLIAASLVAGCRRSKENFQESEQRYRLLVEMAAEAIIIVDREGAILFANPAAQKIFGYPTDRLIDKNLSLLLPEDQHHPHLGELTHRLDTRKLIEPAEFTGRHRDGRELPLEITFGTFIRNGSQVYTAIIRDTTARKQADEARAQLAAIAESAEEAIIGMTLDGLVHSWNPSAEQVYGYSTQEARGRPVAMLVPRELHGDLNLALEKISRGERVSHQQMTLLTKSGQPVPVHLTFCPIKNCKNEITGAAMIALRLEDTHGQTQVA